MYFPIVRGEKFTLITILFKVNVFKLFEIFQALAPMYIVHILQNDSIQRLHKNLKGIILFSKTQFFKYRFGVFDILPSIIGNIIIPVTRRVKGYTRFLEKYVSGRRKLSDPIKYIYSRSGSLTESF